MITFLITFSQLEDRIDARFYKPSYINLSSALKNYEQLGAYLSKINRGSQPQYATFSTEYKVVKTKQIDGLFTDYNNLENILVESYLRNEKSQLQREDVLLNSTGIGSICRPAFWIENLKAIADGHVTIIRTKDRNQLNPAFIFIYLLSSVGQTLLEREITGATGQIELYPDNIKSIKILIPPQSFQQLIEKLVKKAHQKRKQADEKYKEAEELLEKELGLKNLDLSTEKTYQAVFSEISDRFDPEYYQPKYYLIHKLLNKRKLKAVPLGWLVKIRKGVEVGHEAYADEGMPFLRVADFSEREIDIININYIRPYLYNKLKETHKPSPGEIIFSKDGTVGRAIVVPKDKHEFIVSGGILILTPKNIDNYYLALVLNSSVCQSQVIRNSIGAVIQHLRLEKVKEIKVPFLSKATQQKTSKLIQQSFKLHKESKALIEKAKRKVETSIETQSKGDDRFGILR